MSVHPLPGQPEVTVVVTPVAPRPPGRRGTAAWADFRPIIWMLGELELNVVVCLPDGDESDGEFRDRVAAHLAAGRPTTVLAGIEAWEGCPWLLDAVAADPRTAAAGRVLLCTLAEHDLMRLSEASRAAVDAAFSLSLHEDMANWLRHAAFLRHRA